MAKITFQLSVFVALLLAGTLATFAADNMPLSQKQNRIDGQRVLALYQTVPDALGDIELTVSDETLPVAKLLVAALQQRQPGLIVNLRTVPLTESRQWWHITPASDTALFFMPMSSQEKSDFIKLRGYKPLELRIAADAIAVVVNRNNPVLSRGLTLKELDGIFSQTRRHGHPPLRSWGQLGLDNSWQARPIRPLAQINTTSLSRHFRNLALEGGDYRSGIPRLMSSAQVIQRVSDETSAIGYIRHSQVDRRVGAVSISGRDEESKADSSSVNTPHLQNPSGLQNPPSGLQNPLGFWLYLYADHKPGSPMAATTRALLRFCYSQEGQQLISEAGYKTVTAEIAQDDFNKHMIDRP